MADHVRDRRQLGVGSHSLGAEDEGTPVVDGAPGHRVARSFGDRHGLAGDHRLVHIGLALDDDPVHADPLAGANPNEIADMDLVDRDLHVRPVANDRRDLRREIHQLADGIRHMAFRPSLEIAAEQDERYDDRAALEVDVLALEMRVPGVCDQGVGRIGPSRARPQRDEGVHRCGAMTSGTGSDREEPSATPERCRRR